MSQSHLSQQIQNTLDTESDPWNKFALWVFGYTPAFIYTSLESLEKDMVGGHKTTWFLQ